MPIRNARLVDEEMIRRQPLWFARFANRLIGWTDDYCAGGCGYPITGAFSKQIDTVEGIPVKVLLCSLNGECEETATTDPRDGSGRRYSDVRPEIVQAVKLYVPEDHDEPLTIKLALWR